MPDMSGEGELIVGSVCPLCGDPLEYNGNYWCSNIKCKYIMPADRMRPTDKRAFNVAYTLLMQQRNKSADPSVLYVKSDGQPL